MPRKLLVALALSLLLASSLAWAQEAAAPDETPAEPRQPMQWGLYLGWASGGDVSQARFYSQSPDGQPTGARLTPAVDDFTEIGGIWAIALSKRTWFQVRAAVAETTYFDTPNGDIDALVYMVDAGLMPHWEWGFYKLGIPFGIGWAQADADEALADGDIPGANYTLALKSGGAPTYYLGLYNGFMLSEKWELFLDVRLKTFTGLLNVTETNLRSTEVTAGFVQTF
ncbi:MAG: hypothetical protein MUE47_03000 [Acidobacteria bacterium]|jgi:hypothetical protein|nr:hypothetical protein [Acidobacteriota bacterium]